MHIIVSNYKSGIVLDSFQSRANIPVDALQDLVAPECNLSKDWVYLLGEVVSVAPDYMPPERSNRSSYRPPRQAVETTVRALLNGTSRVPQSPKQLNMLTALGASKAGTDLTVFVAGDMTLLRRPCVSVIGTRKVSFEGAARARRVARELSDAGVVVVSGLAEGVDTEAMSAAIGCGGKVVGVIGTPLSKAYPASNANLQEEIYRDHLLISQFPEGTRTFRSSFPQRNRLMAFVSNASVIIEASDTSGTLHQAAECQRLGRWLFIAKSVADNPKLTWPKSFLGQPKTAVLAHTDDILRAIEHDVAV